MKTDDKITKNVLNFGDSIEKVMKSAGNKYPSWNATEDILDGNVYMLKIQLSQIKIKSAAIKS